MTIGKAAWFRGKREADGSYQTPIIQQWLMRKAGVSGNTLNGLGEEKERRPFPVYHHVHLKMPFRFLNWLFLFRNLKSPAYYGAGKEVRRIQNLIKALPTKSSVKTNYQSTAEANQLIQQFAQSIGAASVGVAKLKDSYVFEQYEKPQYPWLVLFAVPMDYKILKSVADHGNDLPGAVHIIDIYNAAGVVATEVGRWVREQGYDSSIHHPMLVDSINILPAAIESGIGVLGKHGSLIHPEMGSCFRLGYLVTDMPLEPTGGEDFGSEDFCLNCQVCINQCPPDAISNDKQLVRGTEKWYVDFDKCMPYFNDANGCGICLAVCPWSLPGAGPKLSKKMLKRRDRLEKKNAANET